jgi:hypothetical protein
VVPNVGETVRHGFGGAVCGVCVSNCTGEVGKRGRLTATDLLGEVLEERSRALDVAELEYALEDLWDWVRDCGHEW